MNNFKVYLCVFITIYTVLLSGVSVFLALTVYEYNSDPVLPPHSNIESIGNGWHNLTIENQCYLYSDRLEIITKQYTGECGHPAPRMTAEVTITSDDVIDAIANKKLKFITEKYATEVAPEEERTP